MEHTCGKDLTPPLGDGGRDGGKRKTIYIAGKVTGLPYNQVKAAFAAAQRHWELAGYNVLNPMLLCAEGTEWQPAMRICLAALAQEADYIHPLPNWHQSRGAAFEMYTANILGIPVI